jgi:mannose-6-phosphate isomerase class I
MTKERMNKYLKGSANYDKYPVIPIECKEQGLIKGWEEITSLIRNQLAKISKPQKMVVLECYQGVLEPEVIHAFQQSITGHYFFSKACMKTEEEINQLVYPDVTDDEIFGYLTRLNMMDFFDKTLLQQFKARVEQQAGIILVIGPGASLMCEEPDILIYLDMPRWEIQQRFRADKVSNLGVENPAEKASLQYKRAFFVDWRVCDRLKKQVLPRADYLIDTTIPNRPKLISKSLYFQGLSETKNRPFRVVPFFDPGPWGGQWMKEYCDLDHTVKNFAWCFDCVPEENSLLFQCDNEVFETPSINLVFFESRALLGDAVHARFGEEFPIRFDFLDTIDGGNLSLQVHPTTQYIQEKFGIHYTQDESYYILDATEEPSVYLGLKKGICPAQMINDLEAAQQGGEAFSAERYVGKWPVQKHDHVLIPAGTIHCSGANTMVLEISATPYIFTFKLWDWGRMGLDGKPRPINIEHGKAVIDWSRNEDWVKKEGINVVTKIAEGDGWIEERTGLHEREFIETRRHWFHKPVLHHTNGGVNVLNLVEGKEAIIESPDQEFEPFVVHYAETFIVPASVTRYSIRPYGESEGKACATIKAFVRTNP